MFSDHSFQKRSFFLQQLRSHDANVGKRNFVYQNSYQNQSINTSPTHDEF